MHNEQRDEKTEWNIFDVTINVNVLIIFIVYDAKESVQRQSKMPL